MGARSSSRERERERETERGDLGPFTYGDGDPRLRDRAAKLSSAR